MSVWARELTARGTGAVSVVAFGGRGALALATRLARIDLPIGVPMLARLEIDGELVDEVLVAALSEEQVELQLHGGTALVRHVLDHLELSHAVEVRTHFRATSLEAEALAALPHAPCSAAARILLDQAGGVLRATLQGLCELDARDLGPALGQLLERGRVARRALRPARVLLAGPVNAGKSTLFNLLVGRARAITDPTPGTTRDVLTECVSFGDWPVLLSDTAGVRELPGASAVEELERAGQAVATGLRARSDLVLWLVAPGQSDRPPSNASAPVETVWTQADRAGPCSARRISVRADPEGARRAIEVLFQRSLALPATAWTPGAAVPFDDDLLSDLKLLGEADARGERGGAVGTVLAPWLAVGAGYRCRTHA